MENTTVHMQLEMLSYSNSLFTHSCVYTWMQYITRFKNTLNMCDFSLITHGDLCRECVFIPFPKCRNAWKYSQLCGKPILCYYILRLQAMWFTALFLVTAAFSCKVIWQWPKRCWHLSNTHSPLKTFWKLAFLLHKCTNY